MRALAGRYAGLWPTAYFAAAALAPALWSDPYVAETLLSLNLSFIYVLSWDLFCGPTRETNFGHSFFIGGAGYLTALLHTAWGLPPWTSGLLGVSAAAAAGAAIAWVADRFRGPSFALATMGFQLMLFQAVFLFPVFGGEEGIVGVSPFIPSRQGRYYLVLAAAGGVTLLRARLQRARAGLLLTAIGEDEELARSSGVRSRRLKVAVFALSAGLGGLGGVLYAHTQGQVNAELASSGLSTHIVLLGLVGGARSGPALAVLVFFLLQRAMAGVVPGEGVVYAASLLAAVLFFPAGIVPRPHTER